MPTKRQFDMTVAVFLGLTLAKGLVKLWAHRTAMEPGSGKANVAAVAVEVMD